MCSVIQSVLPHDLCFVVIKHFTELLFCGSYFSNHCPGLKQISAVPKFFPSPPHSLLPLPPPSCSYFSSLLICLHLWSSVACYAYCLISKNF